jgi:hypothetical protein
VTTENWLAAMAAYAGVSMSCGMSAVPNLRPIFAASARREVGLVPGCALAARGAHREKTASSHC